MIDRHDTIERRFQNGAPPRLPFTLNLSQLLVLPAKVRGAKLPLDHRDQPREIVFRNVVRCPGPYGDNRVLLAYDPGNDDQGKIGSDFLQHAQGLHASKPRHRVIT